MNDFSCNYIWRCANCHNHFSTITKSGGLLRQEKKCSKCKALNILTLDDKEMIIQCRFCDSNPSECNECDKRINQ